MVSGSQLEDPRVYKTREGQIHLPKVAVAIFFEEKWIGFCVNICSQYLYKMLKKVAKFVIVAVPTSTVSFMGYFGYFKKMEIKESQFSGGTMIYIDYQGHIKNIYQPFQQILGDLDQYQNAREKSNQPIALPIGVYYDDPYKLVEPEKNRACAGFFVPHDSKEREEIINFFKEKY